MTKGSKDGLNFRPLTPGRWADLEKLFGARGACGGCWCMSWRLTRRQFEAQKGEPNRRAFKSLVSRGVAHGLLAYRGREPVGWCSFGPRVDFPRLAGSRVLKPLDDQPVWSVTCFFIARPERRRGLTTMLLAAAAAHAARRGARILEGYPLDLGAQTLPDVFAWTGLLAGFRRAGFEECARRSKTRPIMRRRLTGVARGAATRGRVSRGERRRSRGGKA